MTARRSTKQRLQEGLKELRLPTMRDNLQEVAAKARAESLSYEQFLLDLVEPEQATRRQHPHPTHPARLPAATRGYRPATVGGCHVKSTPT